MSYQTQQVRKALPGTLPELTERTGMLAVDVLHNLLRLRAEGQPVKAIQRRGEWSLFTLDDVKNEAHHP